MIEDRGLKIEDRGSSHPRSSIFNLRSSIRRWLAGELRAPATRHSAVTFAGNVARFALSFAASVVIARWLGPASYGLIAIVSTVLAVADTLGDFGLTSAAVRAISRAFQANAEDARALAHGYFSLAFVANVVAAAVGLVFAGPIARFVLGRPDAEPYLRLALLGVVVVTGNGFAISLLQSMRRFRELAALQVLTMLSYLAGAVALAASGHLTVATVVLLGALNPILGFLIGLRFLPPGFVSLAETVAPAARRTWRELAGFGKWLWAASLLWLLGTRLDLLLLGRWAPAAAVGVYALAFNLTMRLDLVNQTRVTVLLPTVSALQTRQEMREYVRRNLARSVLLSLPFALVVPLAGPAIAVFYGPAYAAAAPLFVVLLAVVIFDLITSPLVLLAYPMNAPKVLAAADAVRVATLALAGAALIPAFGPMGAAVAKLAARGTGTAFALGLLWRMSRNLT